MRYRNRHSYKERTRSPLIILIICALSALALTVIVGNLLRLVVDDETDAALRGEVEEVMPPHFTSSVKNVHAYAYALGASLDRVWEDPQVSVSLNMPSGALTYRSPVATHLGSKSYNTRDLVSSMEELSEASTYISGVFYPCAPRLSSASERDAEALREATLMREFLREGGDEILLCSLPFGDVKTDYIISYLKVIKANLEDAPLCVAIPLSELEKDNGYKLLAKLSDVCDLLAVDLCAADGDRSPEEWLAKCDYFITEYDMRLVLSESQKTLIEGARSLKDMQTLSKIPEGEEQFPYSAE